MLFGQRAARAIDALTFGALTLAGCVTDGQQAGTRPSSAEVLDQVREIDLSARFLGALGTADTASRRGSASAELLWKWLPATVGVKPRPNDPGADDDPATTGRFPPGPDTTP